MIGACHLGSTRGLGVDFGAVFFCGRASHSVPCCRVRDDNAPARSAAPSQRQREGNAPSNKADSGHKTTHLLQNFGICRVLPKFSVPWEREIWGVPWVRLRRGVVGWLIFASWRNLSIGSVRGRAAPVGRAPARTPIEGPARGPAPRAARASMLLRKSRFPERGYSPKICLPSE